MFITLIKFASVLAIVAFAVFMIRRLSYAITKRDLKSPENTPVFFQMEDPYIAGLMDAIYKDGKTTGMLKNES